jgi:hypothetical protein
VTTFRPHIGCLPASGGGGGRPPTFLAFPPGRPTVRRVRTIPVAAGDTRRALHACAQGERLITASHAVGIYTKGPPAGSLTSGVAVRRTVRAGRISTSVTATGALRGVRAVVQVHAVCAGGNR